MFAFSRFFSALLSAFLLGARACATNVASSSGGEPPGDAGSGGSIDSASNAGTATKPAIRAVAADAKAGYTGAAFDGFTWKLHTISGESTPTYPSMAIWASSCHLSQRGLRGCLRIRSDTGGIPAVRSEEQYVDRAR